MRLGHGEFSVTRSSNRGQARTERTDPGSPLLGRAAPPSITLADVPSSQNEWGSGELVGLLTVAAIVITVITVLPLSWVGKVLLVVPATVFVFTLVSFLSPNLARLARFLAGASRPGPPFTAAQLGTSDGVRATVIRRGVGEDDMHAGRIVAEHMDGTTHVEELLPPDWDLKAALDATVKNFNVPVKSVRALRGATEVARWRPNLWRRLQMAWRRA